MKACKYPEGCPCLGCELDFAYNAYGHAKTHPRGPEWWQRVRDFLSTDPYRRSRRH